MLTPSINASIQYSRPCRARRLRKALRGAWGRWVCWQRRPCMSSGETSLHSSKRTMRMPLLLLKVWMPTPRRYGTILGGRRGCWSEQLGWGPWGLEGIAGGGAIVGAPRDWQQQNAEHSWGFFPTAKTAQHSTRKDLIREIIRFFERQQLTRNK